MLKRKVSSLDDLDEPIQALYKAEGDAFVLDVEPGDDAGELRRAHERIKAERATLRDKIADYEVRFDGIDPDEFRRLKASGGKGDAQSELEALKAELTRKHEAELAARDQRVSALTHSVHRGALEAAIAKNGGNSELLAPHLLGCTRAAVKDDGTLAFECINPDGSARISPAAGNDVPMTFDELVGEYKGRESFAGAFAGNGKSGGGASRDQGGGGAGTVRSKSDLSNAEAKAAYIAKNGYDAFMELPAGS